MQTQIFCKELKKVGCQVVRLTEWEQENLFMRSVYMKNGLKSSVISPVAVDLMYQAAHQLIDRGADLIVGACSEVAIALEAERLPVTFIDTMDLMAKKVVQECYQPQFVCQ